jgi:hypothetical protein
MGREAIVQAEVGREAGEVRALLESDELILRGAIRRRFERPALEGVAVEGEDLCFTCAGETVRLALGTRLARVWAEAIARPPPSLRAKLGLDKGARALLLGCFGDAALAEALDGVLVEHGADAAMLIACIAGPADLAAACAVHAAYPRLPLWAVYPKGRGVAFGDGEIRAALRAEGFRDSKSCAVSDRLTATRYSPGA